MEILIHVQGWYSNTPHAGSGGGAKSRNEAPVDTLQQEAYLDILKVESGASPAAIRCATQRLALIQCAQFP